MRLNLRLALLGNTGTGKDTCVKIIRKRYPSIKIHIIWLAAPLYLAQHEIYRICEKEKDFFVQDGVLLNFLGQHMRRIKPDVIESLFLRRLRQAPPADLIICPDVRPLDLPFIKQAGFFILHITANEGLAAERRKQRGDLSLGDSSHPTESGCLTGVDAHIANEGSVEAYEEKIVRLLDSLKK